MEITNIYITAMFLVSSYATLGSAQSATFADQQPNLRNTSNIIAWRSFNQRPWTQKATNKTTTVHDKFTRAKQPIYHTAANPSESIRAPVKFNHLAEYWRKHPEEEFKDQAGYWKMTSSVIFCAEKYRWSYWVAEPMSVISSILMAMFAVIGAWHWSRIGWDMRIQYLALATVGFGSAAFHMMMNEVGQAWDEVPMVLGMICFFYNAVKLYAGKSNKSMKLLERNLHKKVVSMKSWLKVIMIGYALIFLATYFLTPHPLILDLNFGVLVTGTVLVFSRSATKKVSAWQLLRPVSSIVFGFSIWLIDNGFCTIIREAKEAHIHRHLTGFADLHSVWHLSAAYAIYDLTQYQLRVKADRQAALAESRPLLSSDN